MKPKNKKKKWVQSVTAVILAAALGIGIFFAARGGDPVDVYPFSMVGMTEFWGDSQESYGPVSTDNIQTVYLSDTQTVTETLVKEGDAVKKGDVLMTFDTTLTELELERKRLDVEKQKLDLKTAEAELERIRNLKPMDPDAMNFLVPTPTEPELGREITGDYEISTDKQYDGSEVNMPLILWLKDDVPLSNQILRAVYEKALAYQAAKETAAPETTAPTAEPLAVSQTDRIQICLLSAQDASVPEEPSSEPETTDDQLPEMPSQTENGTLPTPSTGSNSLPLPADTVETEAAGTIRLYRTCNGNGVGAGELTVGRTGSVIPNAYDNLGKTYWFRSAKRRSDGAELVTLQIPAYPPKDAAEQAQWDAVWGAGIDVEYIRSAPITGYQMGGGSTAEVEAGTTVTLKAGEDAALLFASVMENPPEGTTCTLSVATEDDTLTATVNGSYLMLTGRPEAKKEIPALYEVTALYEFPNNTGGASWQVKETFAFAVAVEETAAPTQRTNDFYMILKVTEEDMERGAALIWQGVHVLVYDDGSFGFTLFDASSLEDHTLEPLEEEEIQLPDIDIGSGLTAAQIAKMRREQEKAVKDQTLALGMAEADYKIMQAEVNDGKIYADFDGTVVSVLTEEESREQNKPVIKVSGGGGFFVEGNVSELLKADLVVGQEVTVSDWNTGGVYTGEVRSIGDFPIAGDGWIGMGNPNASFYPFRVFIDGSADLQAGSYVSVSYTAGTAENGIYLENPFLRTDKDGSYVYVQGEDGKLERRDVTVGKSLWGSYTQVLSGLTEEDLVAFPYGKNVKAGAQTVEGDLSTLYSY